MYSVYHESCDLSSVFNVLRVIQLALTMRSSTACSCIRKSSGKASGTTARATCLKVNAVYDAFNNLTEYRQAGQDDTVKTLLEYGASDAERKKHLFKKEA